MFVAIFALAALSQPPESTTAALAWMQPTSAEPTALAPAATALDWASPTAAEAAALAPIASMTPAAPVPAAEGEDAQFSYTFIEIGATQTDLDDNTVTNKDVDAYYLRASLRIAFAYLFAGYENQQLDFMNTEASVYRLGAGLHFPIVPKLDVIGEAAWLYNDLSSDIAGVDDTSDGIEGRAGLRWMPFVWDGGGIELDGNLIYIDVENRLASEDVGQGWEAGGRVHFLRWFSVGAMYGIIDDDDQISANARFSF